LFQVHTQEPVAPRKIVRDIPPALETICLKCLRKDAAHRYRTAEALAEDLRLFLEGRPIQTRGMRRFLGLSSVGHLAGAWLIVGLVLIATVFAGCSLVLLWMRGEDQKDRVRVVREDALAAQRENTRLRLRAAQARCERGQITSGLFDMAVLLKDIEASAELVDYRNVVRTNLAAWGQSTPGLVWV